MIQSFSETTARSLDQFHPRHFLLFSSPCLEVLAGSCQCCEAIGLLPQQLLWVLMPMLPKPVTGHRLIVIYSGMYRIWATVAATDASFYYGGGGAWVLGGESGEECGGLRLGASGESRGRRGLESLQCAHRSRLLEIL